MAKELYQVRNNKSPKEIQEEEAESPFIIGEIKNIALNLKNNKTPGHDKITNKQLKQGGELLLKSITQLFNKILETSDVDFCKFLSILIEIDRKKIDLIDN